MWIQFFRLIGKISNGVYLNFSINAAIWIHIGSEQAVLE